MALKRYRAVQFQTHYGVIDHGEPVGETVVTQGEGEGEKVPLFQQDGDPENPTTKTTVVFRTADLSPEALAEAHDRADDLNGTTKKKARK